MRVATIVLCELPLLFYQDMRVKTIVFFMRVNIELTRICDIIKNIKVGVGLNEIDKEKLS